MCGIAAAYASDRSVSADILERMNAVQRHRGPDGHSLWVSDRRNVGLGHTRLAIIGLDNGQQPICNEDQSIFVVVNGEFYGYEAIRRELVARGHCFRTESDSEIAVHLYEEHGLQFVDQLRGEFAFILWDERRQLLHAVRDRFGIKPLFHTEQNGTILFASEIKALLQAGKPAEWDHESFWNYIHFSILPERTWFKDIKQVAPGHVLTLSAAGMSTAPYWDLSYPHAPSDYAQDECRFFEEFDATLDDSVKVRTRADVPVGAQLSGGADSTTVAATASRYNASLQTFTVRFPDGAYDEWPVVAKTLEELDVENLAVMYRDSDLFEFLKPAGFHAEWIQENSHGIARFLLSKAIRDEGLKVVLAGEGGDELFCGYAHFHRDLVNTVAMQSGSQPSVPDPAQRSGSEHNPFRHWQACLGYVPTWMTQRYYQITQWVLPLLADDFVAPLRARDPYEGFFENGMVERLEKLSPFHQSLYAFIKTRLPNYILIGERLDMAHGVEVRLPYLDHLLFDCVNRMPLALYRKNGQEKYPLRRALRRIMRTDHIGAKQHFLAPPRMKHGVGRSYRYFLERLVSSAAMKEQPFFNQRKLQKALCNMQNWLPQDSESAEAIWQIVIGVWLMQAQFVGR